MSLMRDNRPRLAHFLPRRRQSGHSSSTYMHADVLQKRKQAANRDPKRLTVRDAAGYKLG